MAGQHPQYPLLELSYDNNHRAHHLSDLDPPAALTPLRPCTHNGHMWDEQYALYVWRAGFVELVWVVNAGVPTLDPPSSHVWKIQYVWTL